ncbi:hypothetical protein [Clostridium botulinum]|uniref:hypothetical protein n=1 Tax=Clostridium botulinum TaxID=1491 RepID=UPI0007744077|nr:hypothetical protein [Clostridium botulinum]NFE95652.1 hypothetical protein [Clostridium botulinum]NFL39710.1 hypothetical protein [Clostridium botulinum]NFL66037.1 hypothetical protein [Clostridium botulinum]NFN09093.1 hypothetical protein [Clostridium botulinum]NFN25710.1 hypothetical protein [Clostridium botulinum]
MEINNNLNYKNIINSDFYKNDLSTSDNKSTVNTTTDSIEINETDFNVINTKKAYDAFKEANKGEVGDNSVLYAIIKDMMKDDGIDVPDFTSNNTTAFFPFIDKMKEYAKNLMTDPNYHQVGAMPLTDEFLDFCDLYKEKLIQYDCK